MQVKIGMNKTLFLFLFFVLHVFGICAQELTVKSFKLAENDISAQTQPRKDLNDRNCALVKVQFVGVISEVEGNVVKPLVSHGNETWVYMPQGSRQLKLLTQSYLPVMVTFADYGMEKLESNRTYVLVMTKPMITVEQQNQTLTIRYTPSSATVLVDNKMVRGSNGVARITLPVGQHTYIVASDGYESEEGMVKLKASAPSDLQIRLSEEVGTTKANEMPQTVPYSSTSVSSSQSSAVSSKYTSNTSVSSDSNVISIPVKNGITIDMVKVEAGTFMMGLVTATCSLKGNVRRVILTNNYYIGKFEVTQELWQTVMGSNPSKFLGNNLPVENVSWNDCQLFLKKLNALTGRQFRLPTEAEWEYACLGGRLSHSNLFSGSCNPSEVAWYRENSYNKTHPVGTKKANELGIFDMSGNVSEWCQDWYEDYNDYNLDEQINPIGPKNGFTRIHKGGDFTSHQNFVKSDARCSLLPNYQLTARFPYYIGFRLALSE